MIVLLTTLVKVLSLLLAMPVLLVVHLDRRKGQEYGVGLKTLVIVASKMLRNTIMISTLGTSPPGVAGTGSGLWLIPARGAFQSELAYTVK